MKINIQLVSRLIVTVCSLVLLLFVMNESNSFELLRFDKYQVYMTPFRFLIIILVMFFFTFVVRKSSLGIFGVLYPTNIFFLFITFMILPGVFLTSDYSPSGTISFYSYAFSIVMFTFGVLAVYLFERGIKVGEREYHNMRSVAYAKSSVLYWLFASVYVVSFILFLLTSNMQTSIFDYVFQFITTGTVSENVSEIAKSRQAIYDEGSNYKGFLSIFSSYSVVMLMPLACTFLFLNALIRKARVELAVAFLLIVITFTCLIANGMRLRGMFFILFVVTAFSFIKPIKFAYVKKMGLIVFILLIIQTITLGRMVPGESFFENIILSANRVVERVFLTKGYVTQKVFEYIPEFTEFKDGNTFLVALGGQLKSNELSFAEEMNEFILGYAGTAGPQAFAEGYANFGLPGMFILAFLLGGFVQFSTYIVKSFISIDPLKITFLAYFSVLIGRIGYGDTFTFKNNGLHVLLVLWISIYIVYRCMSFISRSRKKEFENGGLG